MGPYNTQLKDRIFYLTKTVKNATLNQQTLYLQNDY